MLSLWQNPRINELNLPVVLQISQKRGSAGSKMRWGENLGAPMTLPTALNRPHRICAVPCAWFRLTLSLRPKPGCTRIFGCCHMLGTAQIRADRFKRDSHVLDAPRSLPHRTLPPQYPARRTPPFFALQREVFKHFDEDSRPRDDKIIHNKVAKPRRENISQQGHKDRPFEF